MTIRRLLTSAALGAMGVAMVGCEGGTYSAGATYSEGGGPVYPYVAPAPGPVYYDVGTDYYLLPFDTYWTRYHHDWDRDRAWRYYEHERREHRDRVDRWEREHHDRDRYEHHR